MNKPFTLLRPLNAGGRGNLYIARWHGTGAEVAVKFLRDFNNPIARKAFLREVRVLIQRHRGFVRVLSFDMNVTPPYYVMPLMSGSLVAYAGNFTGDQLHTVAVHVAEALVSIHAAHGVHGDVKPDNVLVNYDGSLQVADPLGNGVNCTVSFAQSRGGGTPGYWAPEVRAGGPISASADVYSFAAMLYNLVTGRRPIDGQSLDPMLLGFRNAPKIREIILLCCRAQQNERPTMAEVLRLLHGEQWAVIETERQHAEIFKAMCAVGLFALVVRALKSTGQT